VNRHGANLFLLESQSLVGFAPWGGRRLHDGFGHDGVLEMEHTGRPLPLDAAAIDNAQHVANVEAEVHAEAVVEPLVEKRDLLAQLLEGIAGEELVHVDDEQQVGVVGQVLEVVGRVGRGDGRRGECGE
jgi:hypothetical protein